MFTEYLYPQSATYGAAGEEAPQAVALPAPDEQAALFLARLTEQDRRSRWFVPVRSQVPGCIPQWKAKSQTTGVHAGDALLSAAQAAIATGGDCYVSVNGFCGNRRTAAGLRQVVSLFFDIDVVKAHSTGSMRGADEAKDAALALIEAAVAEGRFPEPTMAVDTGRGLQLHLVLDRSCSARRADGKPNTRLLQHVGRLQKKLMARLEVVLGEIEWLVNVDRSCTDFTRLCRLPGSWNSKANARAQLVTASGPAHCLDSLRGYVHFGKAPKPSSKPKKPAKRPNLAGSIHASAFEGASPLIAARAAAMESLQADRRRRGEDLGYRNELAWAYMNNLCNVMTAQEAYERTKALNARFSQPLPQSELLATMRSLSRRGTPYKISNTRLAEHLGMTQSELDETGFVAACSSRAAQRRLSCEATAKRKAERNALILSLAASGMVYADIAAKAGCSKRTVSSVLAANGRTRRSNSATQTGMAARPVTRQEKALAGRIARTLGTSGASKAIAPIRPLNAFTQGESVSVEAPVEAPVELRIQGSEVLFGSCKKLSSYSCARGGVSDRPARYPVIHTPGCPPSLGSWLSTTVSVEQDLSTFLSFDDFGDPPGFAHGTDSGIGSALGREGP